MIIDIDLDTRARWFASAHHPSSLCFARDSFLALLCVQSSPEQPTVLWCARHIAKRTSSTSRSYKFLEGNQGNTLGTEERSHFATIRKYKHMKPGKWIGIWSPSNSVGALVIHIEETSFWCPFRKTCLLWWIVTVVSVDGSVPKTEHHLRGGSMTVDHMNISSLQIIRAVQTAAELPHCTRRMCHPKHCGGFCTAHDHIMKEWLGVWYHHDFSDLVEHQLGWILATEQWRSQMKLIFLIW